MIPAEVRNLPALPGPPDDAAPAEHVRALLDTQLRLLVAHDEGTRAGADPEDLHRMRVAVRRIRAVLRAAHPVLAPDWGDELRTELGWLGRALGPVRDLDVLLEHLRVLVDDLPEAERAAAERLLAGLAAEREQAREHMLTALSDRRYPALLRRLAAAVREPLPGPEDGDGPDLTGLVRRQYRALRRRATALARDPAGAEDDELHRIRIASKRLRYVAELATPVMGKRAAKLARAARRLQDLLGEHQDAVVAEQHLRRLVTDPERVDPADPLVAFVAGRLVEQERARRATCRERWWRAWRKVDRRARRV